MASWKWTPDHRALPPGSAAQPMPQKISLGERGPVWWDDGPRDYNRCMVKNTPYRSWHEQLVGPKNS